MKALKLVAMMAALAAGATCAFAQGGPPPDDQGGPPDMQQGPGGPPPMDGGPGGPGRRMGPPPPEPLVMRPDVQKELKLTDDQIDQLRSIFPPRPEMGRGGMGGPPGGNYGGNQDRRQGRMQRGGQGQMQPPMQGMGGPGDMGDPRQQMDAKLKEVLSDAQYKRLKELQLQRQGAEALSRRDVADQVGLSDEVRQRIRGIVEEARESMRRPDQGQRPDPDQMMKQRKAMRDKLNSQILPILTSKERAKWDDLCGKQFQFDETWRPQPPRPPTDDQGRQG